jgi:hypothetical protein
MALRLGSEGGDCVRPELRRSERESADRNLLQKTLDRALADGLGYLKAEVERRTTREP